MTIKYVVYKCTNDMGFTNKSKVDSFDDVESAIEFHKGKSNTDFTWHEIAVEYKSI